MNSKLNSEIHAPITTAVTSASASDIIVIKSRENVMFASAVKQWSKSLSEPLHSPARSCWVSLTTLQVVDRELTKSKITCMYTRTHTHTHERAHTHTNTHTHTHTHTHKTHTHVYV